MGTSGGSKGIPNPTGSATFRADLALILDEIRDRLDEQVDDFGDLGSLPDSWGGQQRWVKDEKTLYVEDDDDGWVPAVPSSTVGVLHVRDEKAANTEGGTGTAGAFTKRTLNTTVTNTIAGASIAADVITLPAGTYEIDAAAPAFGVGGHKLRLQKTNGTPATLIVGQSAFAQQAGTDQSVPNTLALLRGQFTLSGTDTLEVQHRVEATLATIGLGRRSNVGVVEVYCEVIIKQVA